MITKPVYIPWRPTRGIISGHIQDKLMYPELFGKEHQKYITLRTFFLLFWRPVFFSHDVISDAFFQRLFDKGFTLYLNCLKICKPVIYFTLLDYEFRLKNLIRKFTGLANSVFWISDLVSSLPLRSISKSWCTFTVNAKLIRSPFVLLETGRA